MYDVTINDDSFVFTRKEDSKQVIVTDGQIIGLAGNPVKRTPKYYNELVITLALNATPQEMARFYHYSLDDTPAKWQIIRYYEIAARPEYAAMERILKVLLNKLDNSYWSSSFFTTLEASFHLCRYMNEDKCSEKDIIDTINWKQDLRLSEVSYLPHFARLMRHHTVEKNFTQIIAGRPVSEKSVEMVKTVIEKNHIESDQIIAALAKACVAGMIDNLYLFFENFANALNDQCSYCPCDADDAVIAVLYDYLKTCEKCEEVPNFNGNFLNKYVNLKREEKAKMNSVFANKQLARDLTFEDEQFIVVVPTTIKELVEEGENQHNCVGDYGYDEQVIKGNCNIVFVRKKDKPEHSFITCEIGHCGNIEQYYRAYNQRVDGRSPEAEFAQKYKEYLRSIW